MKYVSVCAGIEAATVAWHSLGWRAVAFSEIEKFPCAVLQYHYPETPNWGDMNGFKKWPDANFDVLVGGTPCQSFSVAGLRQGMDDPRGNLALTFCAILSRYSPTWFVWENVPGVLSSDGGRDFGSLVGAMVQLGYGVCWRVLDAQYFGVPQRRRRVFVVGCLGDWRRAAAVLFEPQSLQGHPAPRRETGKVVAPTINARTRGGGGLGTDAELDGALIPDTASAVNTRQRKQQPPDFETYLPDVVGALSDGAHMGGGLNGQDAYSGRIIPWGDEIAHSLRSEGFDASEDGTGRGTPLVAFHNRQDPDVSGDVTHPLGAKDNGLAIAFAQNQRDEVRLMDKAGALSAEPGAKQQTYVAFTASEQANSYAWERDVYPTLNAQVPNDTSNIQHGIRCGMAVRRLTPRECERLQGFPDDYTLIRYRNKPAADGPRYKALGNSMAVPVMHWIGKRIDEMR